MDSPSISLTGTTSTVEQRNEYPRGAVLRTKLSGWRGWFAWHWGVYIGEDTVVHLNAGRGNDRDAIVISHSLAEFSSGGRHHVHFNPPSALIGELASKRANDLLQSADKNGFNGQHCWWSNNCQDFCNACYEFEPSLLALSTNVQFRQLLTTIWDRLVCSELTLAAAIQMLLRSAVETLALWIGLPGNQSVQIATAVDYVVTILRAVISNYAQGLPAVLNAIAFNTTLWIEREQARVGDVASNLSGVFEPACRAHVKNGEVDHSAVTTGWQIA